MEMNVKPLEEQLGQYATYHRDRRNIFTHLFGIPMIMLSTSALLSRLDFAGITPALALSVVIAVYYLRLTPGLGLLMTLLYALAVAFGYWSAQLPTALWLAIGIGGFVIGWALQLIGHRFEGRKPAFSDDLIGLLLGPLFVVAEVLFKLGLQTKLQHEIERRAGPTH